MDLAKLPLPYGDSLFRSGFLLATVLAASTLISCARQESAAERNAEIDRRVDERIEAAHQADERERLVQRQAALEAREKALTAQESSFANMTASLTSESSAAPAEEDTRSDNYAADYSSVPNSYSNPVSTDSPYTDPYNSISDYDPYLTDSPYYYTGTTPVLTIINQNNRGANLRRNFGRAGRNLRRPGFTPRPSGQSVSRSSGPSRQMGARPRVAGGRPNQTISPRPNRLGTASPTVNRSVSGRAGLPRTR